MKTNPREIVLLYNPDSSSDRKTVAHAKSVSRHIKTFAFEKAQLTSTQWQTIFNSLDLNDEKEVFNKAHPYYQSQMRGKSFDMEGMINIIQKNPDIMRSPIALRQNKAIVCSTPTDIYKLT